MLTSRNQNLPSFIVMLSHGCNGGCSLQVGNMADLVVWKPSLFGAKPEIIIKDGDISCASMGDPNSSIPTSEPVRWWYIRVYSREWVWFSFNYNINKPLTQGIFFLKDWKNHSSIPVEICMQNLFCIGQLRSFSGISLWASPVFLRLVIQCFKSKH